MGVIKNWPFEQQIISAGKKALSMLVVLAKRGCLAYINSFDGMPSGPVSFGLTHDLAMVRMDILKR